MVDPEENTPKNIFEDKGKIIIGALFFFGIFLLAVGVGLTLFKGDAKGNSGIQIIDPASVSATPGGSAQEIVVDIGGAVLKGGLYHLASDARVDDAVRAAGGMAADADRANINLASKIHDGQKIYIPKIGEGRVGQNGVMAANTALININTADSPQLDTLPGIGPATAAKIISLRPYASLEDLTAKKAVTQGVFDKIRDKITY